MRVFGWVLIMLGGWYAASASAQQVYKWTDAQGVVHYTTTPPPKDQQAETVKLAPEPSAPAAAPAADVGQTTAGAKDPAAAPGVDLVVKEDPAAAEREARAARCKQARTELGHLQKFGAGMTLETRGDQRRLVSPAQLREEKARWEAQIRQDCG